MARKRKTIPGEELLTKEDVLALEKQAVETVHKEQKDKAKKLLLEELKKQHLATLLPEEEIVNYHVLLPRFASEVTIDGVKYMHGQTYEFSLKQLSSVQDIVQNAWKHEEAAFGARDPNAFIRQRNQTISANAPGHVAIDNHFLRV